MIGDRLARVREEAGLSLREFRDRLDEQAGYDVSHTTVANYEHADSVPSGYLQSVLVAFDVDPVWLLTGDAKSPDASRRIQLRETLEEIRRQLASLESEHGPAVSSLEGLRQEWESFRDDLPSGHPLRTTILASWDRSERAGVEAEPSGDPLRRVSVDELKRRQEANAPLRRAARPHMTWLSMVVAPAPHVVYLVDEDGIVLESAGTHPETHEEQGLAPGFDWSEETMGTNGAGTSLAAGKPVVIFGPEHYARPLHDFVCAASPIQGPDDEPLGALDLSTPLEEGMPERLGLVCYASQAIERTLLRSDPALGADDARATPGEEGGGRPRLSRPSPPQGAVAT